MVDDKHKFIDFDYNDPQHLSFLYGLAKKDPNLFPCFAEITRPLIKQEMMALLKFKNGKYKVLTMSNGVGAKKLGVSLFVNNYDTYMGGDLYFSIDKDAKTEITKDDCYQFLKKVLNNLFNEIYGINYVYIFRLADDKYNKSIAELGSDLLLSTKPIFARGKENRTIICAVRRDIFKPKE